MSGTARVVLWPRWTTLPSIPTPVIEAIESLQLPAMPQVLLRFIEATGDERSSMDSLAHLVKLDPTLSARILAVANSAAFRHGSELRSIKQSLLTLGMRMVQTIATSLAVQNIFSQIPGTSTNDLAGFWRHSLRVAETARAINDELGGAQGEQAHLAGLLHDVGQLILLGGFGDRYRAVLFRSGLEAELERLERSELATDHSAIGAWLVDQWHLPCFMADAILFHHLPAPPTEASDPLIRILWAAHAASVLPVDAAAPLQMAVLADIGRPLGLSADSLARLCAQAAQRVEALATAMGVPDAPPNHTLACHPDALSTRSIAATPDSPAQDQLQAAVGARAAMQPLQQNLFALTSEFELLLAARESARILFGLTRLAFFLVDPARSRLVGAGLGGQPMLLQHLEIPLDRHDSLCTDAALSGQACASFDAGRTAPHSLTDIQIMRAMGSEGLLCVPMNAQQGLIGVMVCGLTAAQHVRLAKRSAWLLSFAQITGASLEAWRQVRERDEQVEATLLGRFQLKGRQVAHEAANPLGIIKNYLNIIGRKLPQASALGEEIGILREEIDRVALIIRQLSEDPVAASVARTTGELDLNGLIESMHALYGEPLFGLSGKRLVLKLQAGATPARADRDSVKQILLNLWKNAADALPPSGSVVTSSASDVIENGRSFTELRVSDSGPGLPEDVLQVLFQPLSANRRSGHAGLGLSIVGSLVERIGGTIRCHSRPGQGTSFVILLPQTDGATR
jgi:HD-like signal output (HDOD) protein/signal transduction histidine kinase